MAVFDSCDTFQVDQGVLLFLASDGLGRPIAALLLSDVSPPREEEDVLEKEEGSNVENVNEVEKLEKKEKEDDKDVLKVKKADIGMKERLELATGLEVVKNCEYMLSTLRPQVSPFTTLYLGLYLCLPGRCLPKQNSRKIHKQILKILTRICNLLFSGRHRCLS